MTLLNEANKIYVGGVAADKVYAGSTKVWPPPPPSPPVMTGLVHWLDANQLVLADGAVMTTWANLGTGAQPTIVGTPGLTFKAGILNSRGVVRFKANEGRLRSAFSGSNVENYTLIYVVRWVGPAAGRAFSAQYPPSNFLVGMHTTLRDVMYSNGTWLGPDDTSWASWTAPGPWRMYGAYGTHFVESRFLINGVLENEIGPGTGGGLASGWALSGYDATATGETMDIDVAELLLYDHQLPDAERISVEGYLRTKWGLP